MDGIKYPGVEKYLNDNDRHKALFKAFFKAYLEYLISQMNAEQLKKYYEYCGSGLEENNDSFPKEGSKKED